MSINTKDRLIFALDVGEVDEAKALVKELADSITFYKIGMELMMSGEYFNLIDWLVSYGIAINEIEGSLCNI